MDVLLDETWSTAQLLRDHPLRWGHTHKSAVYEIGMRSPDEEERIRARRWAPCGPTSMRDPSNMDVSPRDGAFRYDDTEDDDVVVFYPNFADPDLFGYWDGPLLAQDELQVAEHPALAAVRLALLDGGHDTGTLDGERRPTPFTVEGVRRRVAIDVAPTHDRPFGLYGNRFAQADLDQVRAATERLDPAPAVNLVAMTAPVGGHGRYTTIQIHWTLTAAHTAFAAAKACAEGREVRLHTGFWGCGAFGGNRVLMALLQLMAAGAAGIEEVAFHTFDRDGVADLARAQAHLATFAGRLGSAPSDWVMAVDSLALQWGISDGN